MVKRWFILGRNGVPYCGGNLANRSAAIREHILALDGEQPGVYSPHSHKALTSIERRLWRAHYLKGDRVVRAAIVVEGAS